MATYHVPASDRTHTDFSGGIGNCSKEVYPVEADSSGVLKDSSSSTALVAGDIVRAVYLPKGFEVTDIQALVSTAAGQAMTANIGFAYADGVDDASYPQSATAFFSALALNSAARTRTTSAKMARKLPKDAYLIVTCAGVTLASAMKLQLILEGVQR